MVIILINIKNNGLTAFFHKQVFVLIIVKIKIKSPLKGAHIHNITIGIFSIKTYSFSLLGNEKIKQQDRILAFTVYQVLCRVVYSLTY